jgi:hypothetical protein
MFKKIIIETYAVSMITFICCYKGGGVRPARFAGGGTEPERRSGTSRAGGRG